MVVDELDYGFLQALIVGKRSTDGGFAGLTFRHTALNQLGRIDQKSCTGTFGQTLFPYAADFACQRDELLRGFRCNTAFAGDDFGFLLFLWIVEINGHETLTGALF